MAVTGDVWLSLSLGQLVPEIDPNNPGSIASLARDKINEVEGAFQATVNSVNGAIAAAGRLAGQANKVSSALDNAMTGINELANNTGNTGVYFRILGLCPDFPNSLLKNNTEFINAVQQAMVAETGEAQRLILERQQLEIDRSREAQQATIADSNSTQEEVDAATRNLQILDRRQEELNAANAQLEANSDPCAPVFKGDTALIGGAVIVVGAANPLALWEKLKVVAQVFPGIADALAGLGEQGLAIGESIIDNISDLVDTFSQDSLDDLANRFRDFQDQLAAVDDNAIFNADKLIQTNGCDKWSCSRLKDIMPIFDPNRDGSPMNIALGFADEVKNGLTGTLNTVGALQGRAQTLIGELNRLQGEIAALKRSVFDFGDNLASTGIFMHAIGRDLSLNNNQDFVDAVALAMNDREDPGRPTFRGDTAVVAGILMVIGAPNPAGLRNEFDRLQGAIAGFGGRFEDLTESIEDVVSQARELGDTFNTSDVDSSARVGQTAPQRGGTESTLLDAVGVATPGVAAAGAATAAVLATEDTEDTEIDENGNVVTTTTTAVPQLEATEDDQIEVTQGETQYTNTDATNSSEGLVPGSATPTSSEEAIQAQPGDGQRRVAKTAGVGEALRESQRRLRDING